MDIKKAPQSKTFFKVIVAVGIVIAIACIFQAGVWTGYRKAAYSFRWGDSYYRSFGGPRGQFAPGLPHGEMMEAYGVGGRIIKIDLPLLVVEDRDNTEKTVLLKDDTVIRRFRDEIEPADLGIDDQIVVIGEPNDLSQIEAKLIRVMPPGPVGLRAAGRPLSVGCGGRRSDPCRLFKYRR